MMLNNYLVEYNVTRTLEGNGEFSNDQIIEKFTMLSVSNDLNEIFTDLFDKHRLDSIIGLEIIKVINVLESLELNEVLSLVESQKEISGVKVSLGNKKY
jgi:hypothetical protein